MQSTLKRNLEWRAMSRGFSLIEILIVIGVLAILIAVAFPAIQKSRQRADAAACAQKIRQIMAGEIQYSNDNDGYLVAYRDVSGNYWSSMLAPYVTGSDFVPEKNGWIRCPSLNAKDPGGRFIAGIGPILTAYGSHSGQILHTTAAVPVSPMGAGKRISFLNPSRTSSWMDVSGGYYLGNPAYCRGCYPNGAIAANPALRQDDPNNFGMRHNNGANVGFMDGHAEWVSIATLRGATQSGSADFFRHFAP